MKYGGIDKHCMNIHWLKLKDIVKYWYVITGFDSQQYGGKQAGAEQCQAPGSAS